MKYPPVHYNDQLCLDTLLNIQKLRSVEMGRPAHDEMLFVIVHQSYELWFKQILFELDSVLKLFGSEDIEERNMALGVARLERILMIQTHSMGLIDVLETMTPLDFLDFRDFLFPASGFQSFQWRKIETKLGLTPAQRLTFNDAPFWKNLHPTQQQEMQNIIAQPSLFERLEAWLMRTPFLSRPEFDFWETYKNAVLKGIEGDEEIVKTNPRLSENERAKSLQGLATTRSGFLNLFDSEKLSEMQKQGTFRFSNKALQAILFIQIYRDEPVLQTPYRLIACLMNLDEKMTEWRYRHALMAQRMLGRKVGTGGSSGHEYLKSATEQHKVFSDIVTLSSFLIPRSQIPALPESLKREMNFYFRG